MQNVKHTNTNFRPKKEKLPSLMLCRPLCLLCVWVELWKPQLMRTKLAGFTLHGRRWAGMLLLELPQTLLQIQACRRWDMMYSPVPSVVLRELKQDLG